MTNLKSLIVVAVTISLPAATADFTNSFEGITAGSDISLAWATAAAQNDHPLCITAQVIDRGEGGTKANAYKVNVTSMYNGLVRREADTGVSKGKLTRKTASATGTSFKWTGVPYPLRRVKGGLYQVEVRDCSGAATSSSTVLAKSPFFGIEEEEEVAGDGPAPTSSSPPVSSNALAVAVARRTKLETNEMYRHRNHRHLVLQQ